MSQNRFLRAVVFAALLWAAGAGALWKCRSGWQQAVGQAGVIPLTADTDNAMRSIEGFDWTHCEPNGPEFSIHFDSLSTHNAKLGIFTTGLHKVVHIEKLDIGVSRKTGAVDIADSAQNYSGKDKAAIMAEVKALYKAMLGGEVQSVDVSNTTQVDVHDFTFRCGRDEQEEMKITSTVARARYDSRSVGLRGHVVVEARGATLEASEMKWDPREKKLSTAGRWFYTNGDERRTGNGGVFNISEDCKIILTQENGERV